MRHDILILIFFAFILMGGGIALLANENAELRDGNDKLRLGDGE